MLRLAIAFTFLLFISCKKDNDSDFSIVGKWELAATYESNPAWNGCNCWKIIRQGEMGQIVEFKANGTYELIPTNPLPTIFIIGCTGPYERKNDSTLVWNRCGNDIYEAKISHKGLFLSIEEHKFAGKYIYKYRRIR